MTPELLPWFILILIAGSCVGSFLNVVIYRLPAGESIVRPPSHCPRCGHQLRWFENVPVLAWFYLRRRCSQCKLPISIQYPLIEATTAILIAGLFYAYYLTTWHAEFLAAGFFATWPIWLVHAALIAGLLATTLIDARHYIIPLEIPWFLTILAALVLPATALFQPSLGAVGVAPGVHDPAWVIATAGAWLGLITSNLLVYLGILPQSFADETDAPPLHTDTPSEPFEPHPHPRREVFKEAMFLALPIAGTVVGYILGRWLIGSPAEGSTMPAWLSVLMGVLLGYLVGGALVWATRVLGTLAFGKEAMGLGDVHLVAAMGAVLGWPDATVIFFLAPFVALAGTLVTSGLRRMVKGEVGLIPYGPYLAATCLVLMVAHGPIWNGISGMILRSP